MCGRFSLSLTDIDEVARHFHVPPLSVEWNPRYNIAPAQNLLTIATLQGKRQMIFMRWGLKPYWSKNQSHSKELINVRSESLIEKPLFTPYFERQRCLIPADGFFEWKKEGTHKIPFRAIVKHQPLFAFAGLWDQVRQEDGSLQFCSTILTTQANALLHPLHDRMPVILTPQAEEPWLEPNQQSPEQLYALLKPLSANQMEMYEVSSEVNSWKHDHPACIAAKQNFGNQSL